MKESAIQKQILEYLKSIGVYAIKVISASKAGVPDIIGCYRGKFIAIEVKTPKTKTNASELQMANLRWIEESGGKSCIAWDLGGVIKFIKDIDEAVPTSNRNS